MNHRKPPIAKRTHHGTFGCIPVRHSLAAVDAGVLQLTPVDARLPSVVLLQNEPNFAHGGPPRCTSASPPTPSAFRRTISTKPWPPPRPAISKASKSPPRTSRI